MKEKLQPIHRNTILRVYYEQLHANKLNDLKEMTKFLETYNLPRLNQEEIENLNRPITRNEIESLFKTLSTNERTGSDGFIGELYQTLKEELVPHLLKLFHKLKRREHFHSHSIRPSSPWNRNRTKTLQKKKVTGNIPDEHQCENPWQNISQPNPAIYWKDHTPWSREIFSQGCSDDLVCKLINMLQHNNKMKDKKSHDHLNRCWRNFRQNPIHDRNSTKLIQREHSLPVDIQLSQPPLLRGILILVAMRFMTQTLLIMFPFLFSTWAAQGFQVRFDVCTDSGKFSSFKLSTVKVITWSFLFHWFCRIDSFSLHSKL